MTSRWHRSRLFWLGLVGWGLLLLAWFTFPKSILELSYITKSSFHGLEPNQHSYTIGKSASGIDFSTVDYSEEPYSQLSPTAGVWPERYKLKEGPYPPYFGPAVTLADNPGLKGICFANWLIVSTWLLCWLATLVWWQRRKHRLMKSPLGPA